MSITQILIINWSRHLTPLPIDKMAAFSQMTFLNAFSSIQISLKFVPEGPIDNKSVLV